jgi:hypothetical protein
MIYYAELCRVSKIGPQTLGQIDVIDSAGRIVFTCFSIELPDLNDDGIEGNEVRQSCIADGEYRLTFENHMKFGPCYRVHGVPARSGVLIHGGTYHTHTLGCILPAMDQKDINGDGYPDNVSSKKALAELVRYKLEKIRIYTRE